MLRKILTKMRHLSYVIVKLFRQIEVYDQIKMIMLKIFL